MDAAIMISGLVYGFLLLGAYRILEFFVNAITATAGLFVAPEPEPELFNVIGELGKIVFQEPDLFDDPWP